MEILFIISLTSLVFVFAGYPFLLFVVSKLLHRPVNINITKGSDVLPKVSIIIAAYNEEKIIAEKITNTLAIDYPRENLEIIVFSDGSTDQTDAIVSSFSNQGITLLDFGGRLGKTECQNRSVVQSIGDIIIFSDANSMYDPQVIHTIVQYFSDPQVGVVCGELRYIKNEQSQEGLYWRIERFLKRHESMIDSCLGANGAIYALRKSLYIPLSADAISDLVEPFKIYAQGYRVIYSSEAYCTENVGATHQEFSRKRRIITRSFQSLRFIKEFFNVFEYGWYSLTFWFHKVIRWFSFVFLITLLATNILLLNNTILLLFFIVQVCCYIFAFIGIFSRKRIFLIPYHFVTIQLASLLATWDWIRGKRVVTWVVSR